uniref:uncharacterized protein LOC120326844 isoform X1 n=1 Tax=Styela clava TaxID=7725 RepID=UPI001939D3B4|nr:uncharacterized protein LOC120326844 isoform X1 [Styela clava]
MDFVEILFFISLICGLLAEKKIPTGACVSKIVKGKLVQVGDCEKNDGSDIVRLIKKSHDEKAKNKCDVLYNSRCYRVLLYDTKNVTFNDAKLICESMNDGKPANMYDFAVYKLLLTHVRSVISGGTSIWTGMEYKNNQLLLSSGGAVTLPTEVWLPHYPKSTASRRNVAVYVKKNSDEKDQGILNVAPIQEKRGVFCEI